MLFFQALLLFAVAVGPTNAWASPPLEKQPGYIEFSSLGLFDDPEPEAAIEIYLKDPLLDLVAAATRFEDAELADMLEALYLIRVQAYHKAEGQDLDTSYDYESIAERLKALTLPAGSGWCRCVNATNGCSSTCAPRMRPSSGFWYWLGILKRICLHQYRRPIHRQAASCGGIGRNDIARLDSIDSSVALLPMKAQAGSRRGSKPNLRGCHLSPQDQDQEAGCFRALIGFYAIGPEGCRAGHAPRVHPACFCAPPVFRASIPRSPVRGIPSVNGGRVDLLKKSPTKRGDHRVRIRALYVATQSFRRHDRLSVQAADAAASSGWVFISECMSIILTGRMVSFVGDTAQGPPRIGGLQLALQKRYVLPAMHPKNPDCLESYQMAIVEA